MQNQEKENQIGHSRVLKFRAWDKKRKIMVGVDYPDNWGDEKDEWWGDECKMSLEAVTLLCEKERFSVMQYTGLKDKKGKEIYEGDILQRVTVRMGREHRYVPFEVKFEAIEGEQGIYGWGYLDTGSGVGEFEVIGNIYQNPELINN